MISGRPARWVCELDEDFHGTGVDRCNDIEVER
jgi:hypothetical protein